MLTTPVASVLPAGSVRPPAIVQRRPSAPVAGPDRAGGASPTIRAGSDFTALARQVQEAGWMRRRYGYYWSKLIGAVVLLATWVVCFINVGDTWWQLLSAVVLSVLLTQTAFLGHDAAHRQIFVSGRWNDWVSLVVANLLVGLSYGWWQSKHTRHHAAPNVVGSDPDIEPSVLAFTPAHATKARPRLLAWLVAHQGWYFFPLLLAEGVSLHKDALARVLGRAPVRRRGVEITFLTVRLGGLFTLVALVLPPDKVAAFLVVQLAAFGLYMGASFAPNHIGMPLVDRGLKLDFLRRQVLTSRNISGGRLIAAAMGGLNYQVEHHLFPSMARPHLRHVQPLVAGHCATVGLPYTTTTLWQSYGLVVRHLNTVGLKGSDPFLCPLVASRRALPTTPTRPTPSLP